MGAIALNEVQLFTLQMLINMPNPDLSYEWSGGGLKREFEDAINDAIESGSIEWTKIGVDEDFLSKLQRNLTPNAFNSKLVKLGMAKLKFDGRSPFKYERDAFQTIVGHDAFKFFNIGMLQDEKLSLRGMISGRRNVDVKNFPNYYRRKRIDFDQSAVIKIGRDYYIYRGGDALWLAGFLGFGKVPVPTADFSEIYEDAMREKPKDDRPRFDADYESDAPDQPDSSVPYSSEGDYKSLRMRRREELYRNIRSIYR